MSLRHGKHPSLKFQIALVAPILLLCADRARADVFDVTFINVTFSATCIGETATCTEVINASADINDVTHMASDFSGQLTGTLAATLDFGPILCTGGACFPGTDHIYAPPAPGNNPIELSVDIPTPPGFDSPTPTPLVGGNPDIFTGLIVPLNCGGNQPNCGATGSFPGDAIYALTSGTYTSVDIAPSVPEPSSVILLMTGVAMLGFPHAAKQLRSKIWLHGADFSK